MLIERRHTADESGKKIPRVLLLIAETEEESKEFDWAFGTKVGKDGLIGKTEVECRLADGYDEHYLSITCRRIK